MYCIFNYVVLCTVYVEDVLQIQLSYTVYRLCRRCTVYSTILYCVHCTVYVCRCTVYSTSLYCAQSMCVDVLYIQLCFTVYCSVYVEDVLYIQLACTVHNICVYCRCIVYSTMFYCVLFSLCRICTVYSTSLYCAQSVCVDVLYIQLCCTVYTVQSM